MNRNSILKSGVLGLASLLFAVHAHGADKTAAAAVLAEISTIAVQAKAGLAEAASSGDVEAVKEAGKRADAVDAAVAEGQGAFAAMERAMDAGDVDAADAAAGDLAAALQKAKDALDGVIPEVPASEVWKESKTNTGGGPGSPFDPPNMYNKPSQTKAQQDVTQNAWGTLWSSGQIGGGTSGGGFGDRDATPQ